MGCVVAAGLGAGATLLTPDEARIPLTVVCHIRADLAASAVAALPTGADPVGSCLAEWRSGTFGSPSSPELAACVLPTGAIGVFPGPPSTCTRLGLAAVPAARPVAASGGGEAIPANDRAGGTVLDAAELRTALSAALPPTACVTPTAAGPLVAGVLEERGLTGWRVVEAPADGGATPASAQARAAAAAPAAPDPGRACTSVAVDLEQRSVLLVPVARPVAQG
jgi:hypothetical protein